MKSAASRHERRGDPAEPVSGGSSGGTPVARQFRDQVGTPSDVLFDQILDGIRLAQAGVLIVGLPVLVGFACAGLSTLAGASSSLRYFATELAVIFAAFAGGIAFLSERQRAGATRRRELLRVRAAAFIEEGAAPPVDRNSVGGKMASHLLALVLELGSTRFRLGVGFAVLATAIVLGLETGRMLFGETAGGLFQHDATDPGEVWAGIVAVAWIALVMLSVPLMLWTALLQIAWRRGASRHDATL